MTELFEFYIAGSIAIIGIIEWIKKLNIKNIDKYTPYISLALSLIAGLCAANTYEKLTLWNVFICFGGMLACVQLGYQAVVQSICGAIDSYINKKSKETKTEESTKSKEIKVD